MTRRKPRSDRSLDAGRATPSEDELGLGADEARQLKELAGIGGSLKCAVLGIGLTQFDTNG